MRSDRSSNDDARVPDPSILTPPAGQSGDLRAPPSLNVGLHPLHLERQFGQGVVDEGDGGLLVAARVGAQHS
jgi:hypothetical protein